MEPVHYAEAGGGNLLKRCPTTHLVWYELAGKTTTLAHAIFHRSDTPALVR